MFKAIIIVAAACVVAYFLRRNFRRAWYVLRTGDEHPDWEKLGGDYFVASWEKRGLKGPVLTREQPPKRKPWESEHYRMSIFTAAGLLLSASPTAQ